MENRHQQILEEIKALMSSIRSQVEELEKKMAELQYSVDPESVEGDEMEMEIITEPVDDLPFYDDAPEVEEQPELVELPDAEDLPVVDEISLEEVPSEDEYPEVEEYSEVDGTSETEEYAEPEYEVVQEQNEDLPVVDETPIPVIDAMIAKQAWRTDMPGTPVKDIRSAISLNDRILFINFLFNEDPMAFQEMLTKLNSMPSFDEAVAYIVSSHPEWDLESDTVYRFMMALRRRLQ